MTRKFRRKLFGSRAVLIGQRDKFGVHLLLIESAGDGCADRANAQESDFQHVSALSQRKHAIDGTICFARDVFGHADSRSHGFERLNNFVERDCFHEGANGI
ncbi:MAG: hypothetical protein ACREIF_10015, partial [Chthoniobacterales bacterium]